MAFSRADQIRHARAAGPSLRHPRGLLFLFATEAWERFAFFGALALLGLYMARDLIAPDQADRVLGLGPLRSAIEASSGPLAVEQLAAQIQGLFIALAALAPIVGGLVGDRLGRRHMVLLGALLLAVGDFMLMFEPLLLVALLLLVIGNGAFQPNLVTEVGGLYQAGDQRRDRGYAIFYAAIALAALLAPPICGALGDALGWRYGFAATGVGMLIALATYLWAAPALPPDESAASRAQDPDKPPPRAQWRSLLLLLVLIVPLTVFWAAYGQKIDAIPLWLDDHTDRTLDILVWHGEIPTAWFQALNPLMIVIFTPFLTALWSRQEQRGGETPTLKKMAIGAFAAILAYVVMAGAAFAAAGDEAGLWWIVVYFAAVSVGELYLAPVGLSLVSKAAPRNLLSFTMGLWLAAPFVGNLIAGSLAGFWSAIDKASFFLLCAVLAAFAALLILGYARLLRRLAGE
jgi:POT family proton-dependent oligopeptide transporter